MGAEQLSLTEYPHTPGWADVRTSIEAAEKIAGRAMKIRDKVLWVLRRADLPGLTADEVAERLDLTPFTIRPRVTELNKLGLIEDSGLARENESGARAIVWTVTADGERQ